MKIRAARPGLALLLLIVPVPVARARDLTLQERVEAQRAIEGALWARRIWPEENRAPKPALSGVLDDAALLAKVEGYLRKSAALETLWRRPIGAAELQAEMDRMARGTKDPAVLSEIFRALGDDPEVIAETLARQTLADRLARSWYAAGEHEESVPFDAWWRDREADLPVEIVAPDGDYTLPVVEAAPCTADSWSPTLQDAPDGRQSHASVWTGTEFIIWGGTIGTDVQNTGGRYTPATDTWVLTSRGAGVADPRWEHTAIWTGTEMIVWGGMANPNGTTLTNTGGRYNPATDSWTATSTGTNVPSARINHSAVWTGTEMMIWGGLASGTPMNTGGRYNPSTNAWTATSTSGSVPTARSGATAVWTGTQVVIWGGSIPGSVVNTGGRYTPSSNTWTTTSTGANVPSARARHTAVWTGTQMVVWGGVGSTAGSYVNTGGRYNPATNVWTTTSTGASVPAARVDHTAVWTGSEMIVWGGTDGTLRNTGGRYNPTTDAWTATSTGTNVPSARVDHSAVWTGSEMIVWGSTFSNSGGRYSPATNTWVPTSRGTVPFPRFNHAAVWTGAEMIVWGGADGETYGSGGRYTSATDSWTPTSTAGAPTGRHEHGAVWTGSRMIVWGGLDPSSNFVGTGGRYDPATDAWTATSTGAGVPSARAYHGTVWTGSEMIVWGGQDGSGALGTGSRYDPATNVWTAISTGAGVLLPRMQHTAVWSGSEMIVWGGFTTERTNTGGRYDPATNVWTATSTTAGVPEGRVGHTAVWTGSRMVVWGGQNSFGIPIVTGGRYDPATNAWTATATTGVLSGRYEPSAVWTGSHVIFWGGSGFAYANDGSRYDPAGDTWAPMTMTGAPAARGLHSTVLTGDRVIVWGGYPITSSGGAYCACPAGALVYRDADGDGHGDAAISIGSCDGSIPEGYAATATDCDDGDAGVHPGADEVCNGIDDDCDLAADEDIEAPTGRPDVTGGKTGSATDLAWTAIDGATGYDVVKGSLDALRGSGGDFTAGITTCLENDLVGTSTQDTAVPGVGQGLFYLVRAVNACGGAGSYDEPGSSQQGLRDAEIAASGAACP